MEDQNAAQNLSQQGSSADPGSSKSSTPIDWAFISVRAREVLSDPTGIWTKVRSEQTSIVDMFKRYIAPLAVIPVAALFINMSLMSKSWPFFSGLVFVIVYYAAYLALLRLIAFAYEKLAPKFDGSLSSENAVKLIGYSLTPGYLGGVLQIFPGMIFSLLGAVCSLYGLYILYQGITPMSGIAAKRAQFFGAGILASFLLGMVLMSVTFLFAPTPRFVASADQLELQRTIEQLQKLVPQNR